MVSGTNLFIGLFNNLAFFILVVTLYGFLCGHLEKVSPKMRQFILGIVFGVCTIACMYVKIPVHEGVIVDQRNTVVVLAGAFGGPLSALICATIGSSYRAVLGGSGVMAGIVGCQLAAVAGIGLFYFRPYITSIGRAAIASFVAAVIILPGFMFVGNLREGWELTKAMALPYGSAIFVGILLVGMLLENEERRRKASSALVKSEEQFRSMYERMVDVLYHTDLDGVFVAVTPSVEKLLGYPLCEVIGKPMVSIYHDASLYQKFLVKIVNQGYVENFEAELVKKNGDVIWVSTNASLLRNEAGEVLGVDGVTRDISLLKQVETDKTEMEEILRQSQKMEAIGTLAGGIAHDFNNILGAVIGYSDLLRESMSSGSREMEYVDNVLMAAERARQLTQQILMFSRKGKQIRQPIKIQQVIEEVVNLLEKTIPSTVNISADLHPETGVVMGNAVQIHQIVLNLCTNAFHALYNEKGTITISLQTKQLYANGNNKGTELPQGSYAVLTVKDNGKGMEQAVLPRIFEPFFTTKPVGEGTGMGLSVVHGIVKSHGGSITVESELGVGTEFCVRLPITVGAIEKNRALQTQLENGTERILIIDDEQILIDLADQFLSSCGYQVTGTISSIDALKMFRTAPNNFDLVITDQTMPDLPGHMLAREMLTIRPNIPIVILTGHSTLVNAKKAKDAGIKAFMMKPIKNYDLAKTVRKVLDELE